MMMNLRSWSWAGRALGGVGLAVVLPLALSVAVFFVTEARAQNKKGDQHLIVQITSEKQMKVLEETLKGLDSKTYYGTMRSKKGGKVSSVGSLPLEQVTPIQKQASSIKGVAADDGWSIAITVTTSGSKVGKENLERALKAADKAAPFQVTTVTTK